MFGFCELSHVVSTLHALGNSYRLASQGSGRLLVQKARLGTLSHLYRRRAPRCRDISAFNCDLEPGHFGRRAFEEFMIVPRIRHDGDTIDVSVVEATKFHR